MTVFNCSVRVTFRTFHPFILPKIPLPVQQRQLFYVYLLSNKNIVYNCKYHVVWVSKYRRSVLTADVEARLKKIILQVAKEIQVEVIEMEVGEENHVHLLLSVDPQFGVHKAIKRFKGVSSLYLKKEFPQLKKRLLTLWTNSYFVATCGGAPLAKIKKLLKIKSVVAKPRS